MTQNDKELLLKDLCARLPYNVKVKIECGDIPYAPTILAKLDIKRKVALFNFEVRIENCKPYLRPMSSMTEEERKIYTEISSHLCGEISAKTMIDWFNKNHFDYRGLITKGLAIEVTEENNPYEN